MIIIDYGDDHRVCRYRQNQPPEQKYLGFDYKTKVKLKQQSFSTTPPFN